MANKEITKLSDTEQIIVEGIIDKTGSPNITDTQGLKEHLQKLIEGSEFEAKKVINRLAFYKDQVEKIENRKGPFKL
jgi:hypothetical protein